MMHQLTTQEVTYRDYPIQYFCSPGTSIEEIDIIDFWGNMLSNWIRRRPKRAVYSSLIPLIEKDLSSILLHFEIKSETSQVEELTREKLGKTISEGDIAVEMLEHDFVVKMPPKKRYRIQVVVRSVRKGEPRAVERDKFLITE